MKHYMTLVAGKLTDGKYGGLVVNRDTKERHERSDFNTLADARYWARKTAHDLMQGQNYRLAAISGLGRDRYRSNLWVAA